MNVGMNGLMNDGWKDARLMDECGVGGWMDLF